MQLYERLAARCDGTVLSRSITPKMAALQNICVMAIPIYIAITFYPLVVDLGPELLVGILVLTWVAAAAVQCVICELISWDPNAAGQFHWIYRLRRWKAASFMVGNILCFTWTCGTTAVSYFNASNLVGVIALHSPAAATHIWLPWLLTSLFIVVAVFGAALVISAARYMWPVLLAAWVLFISWYLAMFLSADLQSPFGDRLYAAQDTGLLRAEMVIYAFLGGIVSFSIQDTGSHLGEEYESARTKLPAGILFGHAVNGVLALATLLALMAATPDLDVIAKAPFGQAPLYLCLSMPSRDISPIAKADSIGIMTSIMLLTAGSFGLATASRCIFAGARIGLFPNVINKPLALLYRSKPWPAMVAAALASLLWALFTFSSYAFTIIASLSTLGLWCSFIVTLVCMALHKRSQKELPDGGAAFPNFWIISTTASLHVRFGICVFATTCAVPIFLILCLPATLDPSEINAASFPWAPIVFLIVIIAAGLNYYFGFHSYHPDHFKREDEEATSEHDVEVMQKYPDVVESGPGR